MNEFRKDLVSGDWVLFATGRADRPKFLDAKIPPRKRSPKAGCPFEDPMTTNGAAPILLHPAKGAWKIAVVPNRYPALAEHGAHSAAFRHGIYEGRTAVGTHNLLITRDHDTPFTDLSPAAAGAVFATFQELHRAAAQDPCLAYVSSFHNYGPLAGSSVWHPHYQILSLPIIPAHVQHSLRGAEEYFKAHRRCVRCDIIREERTRGVRVIAMNAHAIAVAPYASKKPFEISILPLRHHDSLRDTPGAALRGVAELARVAARKLRQYLRDPDYNFFIHDTPLDRKAYPHHHWHVEMVPRLSIDAGFELSTSIIINVMDPDRAAAMLRGAARVRPAKKTRMS